MAKLNISDEWWTAPAEADNGNLIMVTGRKGLQNVIDTGKYVYRIEMTWPYVPDATGMPGIDDSKTMEAVQDAIDDTFGHDPVAVVTGIYTGDGKRDWVLYCRSLNIFQRKLNEALSGFEALPLEFHAYDDPGWEEYREMCQAEVDSSD